MKRLILFLFILLAVLPSYLQSQVSYGGRPRFIAENVLRSSLSSFFIEMPKFSLDSAIAASYRDEDRFRRPYMFAHKFYTNIKFQDKSELSVLHDGTKVRRLGIRSEGALSLSLLLTDFHLPEGGKLFVYTADNASFIGAFDYRNNNRERILPIRPIAGEAIIIEYSEPMNADFEGSFTIAEVNHDYRGYFRREPGRDNTSEYLCMPDVLCGDVPEELIRSTLLIIMDGVYAFSGTLINNTSEDGRPLVLTAVHCLNSEFPKKQNEEYYRKKAATAIAFFNYNRPFCDNNLKIKGTEQMSIAVSEPKMIFHDNDIALLEFQETPPDYYNPYFAGWNICETGQNPPYMNLHHPNAAVKKYGIANKKLNISNFDETIFTGKTHWEITSWDTGSTHAGSSGSPLFDSNGMIIGGLTGGSSTCKGTTPNGESDYFFILKNGWNTGNVENQLKTYLDPVNKGDSICGGFDPNKENKLTAICHVDYNNGDQLITSVLSTPNSGYVFGNGDVMATEFAEEFSVSRESHLIGAFLYLPPMPYSSTENVSVSVYSGASNPDKLLATFPLSATFTENSGENFTESNQSLDYISSENFVFFEDTVLVTGKFFISYKVNYNPAGKFCVYNAHFGNPEKANTAWIKNESGQWQTANEYQYFGNSTALSIKALLKSSENNNGDTIADENAVYFDRKNRSLYVATKENTNGEIYVYSLNGVLIQKINYQGGKKQFVLNQMPSGTIAIVKVINDNKMWRKKIIY